MALAEDEGVLLDYVVQLFWQINICVVIMILITVQIQKWCKWIAV